MKKFKELCVKGIVIMGILVCANSAYASNASQVTVNQSQLSKEKADLTIGLKALGEEVVAAEMSVVLENVSDVLNIEGLEGIEGYYTYNLKALENSKTKLIIYMVSGDANVPLSIDDIKITMQTSSKLTVDTSSMVMKVIEKGYKIGEYTKVPFVFTETVDSSVTNPEDSNNNSDSGSNDSNASSSNTNNSNTNTSGNQKPIDNKKPITSHFTDFENHWAKEAILSMANKGIIKGYEDGSFKPNGSITRGEFATLLARAFNLETNKATSMFKDVAQDKWYTNSILALYEAGITSGMADGNFGVNRPITNEEIATMLYRTINVLELNVDVVESGITFADYNQISNYAKEAVSALSQMGVISGKPDGTFGAKASTSRGQVAVMLERIFSRM